MLYNRGLCRHAVCVCVCVCVSVTFVHSVKTNKHIFKKFSTSGSHTILVFFIKQTAWQFRRKPPNGGTQCRRGKAEISILSQWLHCVLRSVPAATAIHLAATDHGEFITLVAGKRRSLLMAGNNDEVYDKKPQRYAEDNVTQW